MTASIQPVLLSLLQQHPQGLSEFEILKHLQQQGLTHFDAEMFSDDLSMFRAHFLLFHLLYRLRDQLLAKQQGTLDIHVLKIQLLPWQPLVEADKRNHLIGVDHLRDYYLDLANLKQTTLEDVEQLLGSFWVGYLAREKQADALKVMGLQLDCSRATIEKSYRQLAMQYHPDRGGDAEHFQKLHQAVQVLRRCYS